MFHKPPAWKSKTQLKSSEKKKFIERYVGEVPRSCTELSPKNDLAASKVNLAPGNIPATVYWHNETPLAFETRDCSALIPTVYGMWLLRSGEHERLPSIYMDEATLRYLVNGADLMLPGVVRSPAPLAVPAALQCGSLVQLIAVQCDANATQWRARGAVALAQAAMDSQQLMTATGGRAFRILHVVGDHLWQAGSKQAPPEWHIAAGGTGETAHDATCGQVAHIAQALGESLQFHGDRCGASEPTAANDDGSDPDEVPYEQDELLHLCFLTALKYRLKADALPIDVGQFYVRHVLKCLPTDVRLDIKKTKYKKLSMYLNSFTEYDQPLVQIKRISDGVDVLAEVNWDHDDLRHFKPPPNFITDDPVEEAESDDKFEPPLIATMHEVNGPAAKVLPLAKGQLVTAADLRTAFTQYVKTKDLQPADAPNEIELDDALRSWLAGDLRREYRVTWQDAIRRALQVVPTRTVLTWPHSRMTKVVKGALSKVTLKVERRSNKTVTLVCHLAEYSIDCGRFAERLQRAAAASATTVDGGQTVLVQGNQVSSVADLLLNVYSLPRSQISGLELAPKAKKKK